MPELRKGGRKQSQYCEGCVKPRQKLSVLMFKTALFSDKPLSGGFTAYKQTENNTD